jgi:MFS family permease
MRCPIHHVGADAVVATFAPISALLLSVTLLLMGNGLQGTLLPVRAQLEFFSTFDIGILGASYYLGFAGGCYFGPYVVRRVGHIRAFAAMVSLASAVTLVHAMLLEPALWWPLRALTGFCFAVLFMVIESWLNEKSTNENRGIVFSIYTIINLTVMSVGQMMLTLADPKLFALFAVSSILVSLAALPVALSRAVAPEPIESSEIRIRHLFKSSPVGFVGAVVVGFANGAFWSLAPVFAQSNSSIAGTAGVAIFMSVAVIAGAIGQWPFGWLSDKIDRRFVIVILCVGAAVVAVGMNVFGRGSEYAPYWFSFFLGMFAFPLYAISAAHMNDSVKTGGFVEASSGLLLLFAAGAVIGPLIASAAMRFIGPGGLYYFMAAVFTGMALFTLYRTGQSARPVAEERELFVESILVSQTVVSLDPLADQPVAE